MQITYEKLPLVNKNALKIESRRSKVAKAPTIETITQDNDDAKKNH